jgi:aspartyl-tRNA(Asn)/glutamyl-tRNA(Gln) amidotransferase subunit C
MISDDDVRHITKLAKMNLSEKEITKFTEELSKILDYFAILEKVNTNKIEETSQVTGTTNISRLDEIEMSEIEDELLECSPHKIKNHSIRLPRIL